MPRPPGQPRHRRRAVKPRTVVAAAAALALGAPSASHARPAHAAAAPLRVMSINACADQLVLALLPPSRIVSVTWLSRDPEGSQMWRAARRVPVNHGLAEEVARERPDLVIAGTYTTPATRALLQSVHFPLLVIPDATSFADVRRTTLQVADAVGAPERGRALVAHLDETLAALARARAGDKGPPMRVAAWDSAGFSAAPGTLYDALLTAAGARNVLDDPRGLGAAAPEVERLLAASPQLLVAGAPAFRQPSRHLEVARHPLVQRFWGDRTLVVPASAYSCGTPFSADAAVTLRAQMRALAARARTPLAYRAEWAQ